MKGLLSMTAFGRGEAHAGPVTWTVEIHSVNHRFLDLKVRTPRDLMDIEERIKKELATVFSRGHIEVSVASRGETTELHVRPNLALAREYHQALVAIQKKLSLPGQPDLTMVAGREGVITSVDQTADVEAVWAAMRPALAKAMQQCQRMREKEGQALKKELLRLLKQIDRRVQDIAVALPGILAARQTALKERLDKLLQGVDIDPARLAQEAALLVDKVDITEEMTRTRSHIEQFHDYLNLDEPVGRRLDFLLQEFNREINTVASKINNSEVAHLSVELKNDIEKMREQVQNLE